MTEVVQINTEMLTRRIRLALPRYSYRFANEVQLHAGLAQALEAEGIRFEREYVLGADRFDFLCDGRIVLEAKVDGSMSAALRQAERYCRHEVVEAVIVVSSRAWRGVSAERSITFHAKPVHLIHVRGQAF